MKASHSQNVIGARAQHTLLVENATGTGCQGKTKVCVDGGITRQQLLAQMAAALELSNHEGLRLEYWDIEFEEFANVQDVSRLPPKCKARLCLSAAVGATSTLTSSPAGTEATPSRNGPPSDGLIHMATGVDLAFMNAVAAVGGFGGLGQSPRSVTALPVPPLSSSAPLASIPMATAVEPASLPAAALVPQGGTKGLRESLRESPTSSCAGPAAEAAKAAKVDYTRLSVMVPWGTTGAVQATAGRTPTGPTAPAAGPAPTATGKEVAQLLARRAAARHGRRFKEADQLRDALLARGVQISDKLRVWRANDGSSGPLAGPPGASSGGCERDEIERCVLARERMRFARDWAGADRARRDLEVRLGVQVDDVQQRWWSTRPAKGGNAGAGAEGSTCYHTPSVADMRAAAKAAALARRAKGTAGAVRQAAPCSQREVAVHGGAFALLSDSDSEDFDSADPGEALWQVAC